MKEKEKKKKQRTKQQLIDDYETLDEELNHIEGEMDMIRTELQKRFEYDVFEF